MKIRKPLACASLLGMACALPAHAHGPYTDADSRSDRTRHVHVHMHDMDVWDNGTSRDAHGLPTHGAIGTGSMSREWAMSTPDGGYSTRSPRSQPSYAPRERRMSDDYRYRGY